MIIATALYEALYAQPINVPVFNPIALELLNLLESPETDFFTVIGTIKEDQAISAHVLKMANSTSYRGLTCCDTIEKAAIRLGTHQLANLAIAASQASLHTSHDPLVNSIMQDLWLHSHACALGCHYLASKSGHQRLADLAYMAGLLHDIGKLYLLKAMESVSHAPSCNIRLERELLVHVFAELHVEFGCRVMEQFNIPILYEQIVAHHHDHSQHHDIIVNTLAGIVRIVNESSRRFQLDLYPTIDGDTIPLPEIDAVPMTESNLAKLESIMSECRAEM